MKIIAGLGNPGDKYQATRHNVGFMVTEHLASSNNINGRFESKFNAIIGKGSIGDEEVLIVQPMTFMNLSGESIAKILGFYKLDKEDLLVVYDDLSIDVGKIRFRPSGSDGGHNGIKSIIKCLGNYKGFPRLKVGIGPQPPGMSAEAFVLQKFQKDEQELLQKTVPVCSEAIECFIKHGIDKARNNFNGVDVSKI